MTTADQTGEIPQFTIDTLRVEDIPQLQPALEAWIRDSETHDVLRDEIAAVNERMRGSIEGNNGYRYFVARDLDGRAVGVMGIRKPEEKMLSFATTANPAELVNAYMSPLSRGKGIGKALILGVLQEAKKMGYTEIILNSGPRYRDTAWGFYDRIMQRCGKYEGEYYDGPVWQLLLQ